MEFFKDGQRILKEYSRDWRRANGHSPSMKVSARELRPVSGSDYNITMRFEADSSERIFGMGQYDQYMFGSKYRVAPVLYHGMTEREVYLPSGTWKSIHDGRIYSGGKTITADAPIDIMPVFERIA